MDTISSILTLFSGFSFLLYGYGLLTSKKMKQEFIRYNLAKFLKTIGILQIIGGSGLLLGFYYTPILMISSFGLGTLMLLAFMVRLRIKDGFWLSVPSFLFMLINYYICFSEIKNI